MADSFDPYYKWLGISPDEQPPNHYRLLAINLFESDPDVIEAAADRQMSHLRGYQTGPHSAHSQKLLNECAAARLTLLNPRKKTDYDRQLRDKSVPRSQPSPPFAPLIDVAAPSPVDRFATHRRKDKPAWLISAAGVGGAIALALVIWIALRPSKSSDLKNRQLKTVAAGSPRTSIADSSHKQAAAAPVNEAAPAPASVAPPTPPALRDSALADTIPLGGSISTAVDDADSHRRDDGPYLDLVVAPGVTMRLVKIPASADGKIKSFYLGQTEVTEAQWAAVMGGQSEHPSLPRVGMTFNDCKNFLSKVSEASNMRLRLRPLTKDEAQFVTGDESKYGLDATWCLENSQRQPRPVATAKPNEFELFDIVGNAWEFCEDGFIYGTCFTTPQDQRGFRIHMPGNGDANFKAPDVGFRIAADLLTTSEEHTEFRGTADIPASELGAKTSTGEDPRAASPVGGHSELTKRQFDDRMAAVKAQASAARSADEFGSLALEYASLVTLAVELDDYERANRLAATMVRDARKTRDRGLQDDMRLRAKQAQEMRSAFNQAKPALTALEVDPASADANAAWGRYVAWVKDNWHDGLPLLARGGDEVAAVAARELDEPKSPEAKVVLADDWLETARREKGQVQRTIEEHACRWYEQAASELAPADRQAVLKKIERSFGDTAIHELDATGSRIELGGAEANLGPEATLEFWVCTKARGVPLLTKRQRRDDQSLTFYMSGGNINLVSDGPDHRADIWDAASAPIDDDRWHHVAAVKCGKSLSVVVDGRLAGTGEGLELYRSESAGYSARIGPGTTRMGKGDFVVYGSRPSLATIHLSSPAARTSAINTPLGCGSFMRAEGTKARLTIGATPAAC